VDYPEKCPKCLSKFSDIRGVIYPSGNANDNFQCDDVWHRGPGYSPDVLILTLADQEFLAEMNIGF
jgi:hypothetical protein